jgi:DNA-directed RNA polymerase specialized sigma24 family protein
LTNVYLTWRRGRRLRPAIPYAEAPEVPVGDATESTALRQEIWARLGRLAPRQRAAVVLRYYEDLPDAEILGCAVGTVRSQISRALETLRRTAPCSRVP